MVVDAVWRPGGRTCRRVTVGDGALQLLSPGLGAQARTGAHRARPAQCRWRARARLALPPSPEQAARGRLGRHHPTFRMDFTARLVSPCSIIVFVLILSLWPLRPTSGCSLAMTPFDFRIFAHMLFIGVFSLCPGLPLCSCLLRRDPEQSEVSGIPRD
jgi:hypothetical protein